MDTNVLTFEALVMVPVANASFGVGGEAREPAETEMGDERCGELIWRREKYAGRLARLREYFDFWETVEPSCSRSLSERSRSCSPGKSELVAEWLSSSVEGGLRGMPGVKPELEPEDVRLWSNGMVERLLVVDGRRTYDRREEPTDFAT